MHNPTFRPGVLLSSFWLALLFNQSLAKLSNRTIDDVFGDSVSRQTPVFLPEDLGVWKDQTCGDCSINPDRSQAHHNTYHSATYNPGLQSINVTMNFEGTAIYVFLILANNSGPGITTETNCVFKLDGAIEGSFSSPPSTSANSQFNVLAFSKAGIPSGNHKLVIATENLQKNSYLNFDYAIYTHEDNITTSRAGSVTQTLSQLPSATSSISPPQPNSNKVPAGAIAGGVIGGVACLAAIGICLFFCYRRQRRNRVGRVNLLDDFDGETPSNRRNPLPLSLDDSNHSQPNALNTAAAPGTPFIPGAWPPQTSEISRSSYLPSENQPLSYNPPSSTYNPPSSTYNPPSSTHTPFVVSNPDYQNSREARQIELKRQVTSMRGQIENLKASLRTQTRAESSTAASDVDGMTSPSDDTTLVPPREAVNVKELRAQIRMLTEEVSFLQAQQSSHLALDLAREPPPVYTRSG